MNILIPRRNPQEREKLYKHYINQKVKEYIKKGCEGNLDLQSTPITSLPNNLHTIKGSLNLSDTQISSLPDNLKIQNSLALSNTQISKLPERLEVGSTYKSHLGQGLLMYKTP